ncbi:type IV secretory pathway TraG/TraD family ATPase VirD4 [Paenibacillus mucilaginosus]|uniref:hypothetical protein n=1 Tax=Paenibacillus mucilaginosus TaxID=61624 RepID=UPI003D224C36
MNRLLSVITFPFLLPFKLNTALAKIMPNRFVHWLLVSVLSGIAAYWAVMGLVSYLVASGQLTPETDVTEFPAGAMIGLFGLISVGSMLVMTAPFWPGANRVYQEKKRPRTFGDARFSTGSELAAARLIGAPGVVFGRKDGKLVENHQRLRGMC